MSAAGTAFDATVRPAPSEPDPPAEPPPRATLLNVQALRALAAFMVVFVHLQGLVMLAGLPTAPLEFGNGGVDLFFVISGFIMVFTTGRKPMGPLAFMGARVRRIVPLYWAVTLAVAAVARFAPQLIQNTEADFRHLIGSLLFLPMMRGDGMLRPVVFVGWTLNFEMAFYVVFALGLVLRRRVLGVLLTVAVLVAAVLWGAAAKPVEPLAQFYTTPMIVEFGLGMLLGLAWPYLKPGRGLSLALAAGALAAFALMLAGPLLWPQVERLFAFGLPAAVIVAACLALERGGFALRWAWPRLLGNASYAIYLSHFFVTQAVVLLARKAHLHGLPEVALAMGLSLAGVALAGVGLHYTLERGADALIAALLRRSSAAKLSFR